MTFTTGFILARIAPVFLLLGLGLFLRSRRVLTTEADGSLMQLTVRVLYPALILKFILGNEALLAGTGLWLAPAVGFGTVVTGFGVGWLASRLLPRRHPLTGRTFALTTGIYNYGYIPIPIVLALFGEEAGRIIGVLLLHNVGVEAAFWTAGVALLTAGRSAGAWKRVFNPATLTLIVAVVLNQTGAHAHVPAMAYETIDWLAACAIPFGLILSGATLADLLKVERGLLRDWRTPGLACALRLGLLPIGFLLLARYLPGASEDLRRVIAIEAAMPAGIFPLVVNRFYGGDSRTAVQVVLGTTALGLFTIPLWLSFGLDWIG
jgi:malate permease and related proteins